MDDLWSVCAALLGPVVAELAKRWNLTREAAVSVNVAATLALFVAVCLLEHGFDTGYLEDCARLGLAAGGASSMALNLLYRARAGRQVKENGGTG
jgi:hypothetical protein